MYYNSVNGLANDVAKKPLILIWTTIFGKQAPLKIHIAECSIMQKCIFSLEHSDLPLAKAVVFHAPDVPRIIGQVQVEYNFALSFLALSL
jgi:hypothetical protein